jgi:hypothetical protein
LREDYGSVAVGLEVDADIEVLGRVVQVLDSGGSADDWQVEGLLDVLGRCAIGVRRLYDSNLELLSETGFPGKVANE